VDNLIYGEDKVQQPYDEETTNNIKLNDHEVLMCNIPFSQSLLDAKYFKGFGLDVMGYDCMNIAFTDDKVPVLKKGDTAEWHYYEENYKVQVIDTYKLFVKGIKVHLFLVQLKEAFLEE